MFDLEEELKKLPAKPGVYLMHNDKDEIIYVGKAKVLKNRVRQYFHGQEYKRSPQIAQMIKLISWFEYIVVDSEMEALVLECNFIKEYHPRYNTMLMDDKAYPYIKITSKDDFPRVIYALQRVNDKAKYFGPYPAGFAAKQSHELLRRIYKFRSCAKKLPDENCKRPCIYYDMGQCDAPCCGYITKEEYAKKIEAVTDFLNGKLGPVIDMLEKKMLDASEELEFEKAAEYRDLLQNVKQMANKQKVTASDAGNRDIIALASTGTEAVVQVFFIREGKMLGREHYHLENVKGETHASIMTSFIKQYYAGSPVIPHELFLSDDIDGEEASLICDWLSGKRGAKVNIVVPKKGQKEKLVELAQKNATLILTQDGERIKAEELAARKGLRELSEILSMPGLSRIEAYDISNISGFASVGSMIVFEDGKAKKNAYRKFKIKTVNGPNDYASLKEVLTRRFLHAESEREKLSEDGLDEALGSFTRLPDLILMDGGRGQVNVALEVMAECGVEIPVCGMVKDDNHHTRGLFCNNVELPIKPSSEAFRLITRIQDETHRFAIEYHRSLRTKAQVHSILDDIDGIGEKRRRALMRHFKSLDELKNAPVEEIAAVEGMNMKAAENVKEFLKK